MKYFTLSRVRPFICDHFLLNRQIPLLKFFKLFLLVCVLVFLAGKESYSQDEQHLVDVSVYWVKETVVCAPHGYSSSYDADVEGKKCAPLDVDQLSKFGQTVASKVPPKSIPLGYIGELVNDYRKKCTLSNPCKNPDDRYALVLAFKFNMVNPKGTIVSLERKIPEDLLRFFEGDHQKGNYYVEHELDHGGQWINHQRADLFLPGYKIQWILKAGHYRWELGTE